MFSSKSFMCLKCLALHLGLWSISSLFLCMVLWSVLLSFFYIQLFSFSQLIERTGNFEI